VAQRADAVIHPADLQRAEQLRHGIGRAQPLGFGHLLDSVGMQIGEVNFAGKPAAAVGAQRVVDDPDQRVIAFVKEKFVQLFAHNIPPS
jgi:hypothetical protein